MAEIIFWNISKSKTNNFFFNSKIKKKNIFHLALKRALPDIIWPCRSQWISGLGFPSALQWRCTSSWSLTVCRILMKGSCTFLFWLEFKNLNRSLIWTLSFGLERAVDLKTLRVMKDSSSPIAEIAEHL